MTPLEAGRLEGDSVSSFRSCTGKGNRAAAHPSTPWSRRFQVAELLKGWIRNAVDGTLAAEAMEVSLKTHA